MQGKVEKFHLGLNQGMSHYVNKYGDDWDEFVNYALMAHHAVPHSTTRYSPFYLLYGRETRLPAEDDLTPRNLWRKMALTARIQYSTIWKRWPIDLMKLIMWLEKTTKLAEKGRRSITTSGQSWLHSSREIWYIWKRWWTADRNARNLGLDGKGLTRWFGACLI